MLRPDEVRRLAEAQNRLQDTMSAKAAADMLGISHQALADITKDGSCPDPCDRSGQ